MPPHFRPHFIHRLMAVLVALGGFYDLIDGMWTRHLRRLTPFAEWLPLEVHQGSRALLVLAGIVLLALGRGLGRGKRRAWQLALVAVSSSLLAHLLRNRHPAFLLPPFVLLIYLIVARRYFIASSDPASTQRSWLLAPALLSALLAYGTLGQYHLRHAIEPPFTLARALRATLWAAIFSGSLGITPLTRHAQAFLGSIAWLSIGSVLLLVWLLLRRVILRSLDPSFPEAHSLIRRYGEDSLAAFAAEPDKHHFMAAGGRATVAYRVVNGVAITVGGPIGPPEALQAAVDDFLAYCRQHDWVPCFYEVPASGLPFYRRRGLRALKVAEEAVISLPDYSLRGAKLQKLRQSINKVEREHPLLNVEFFDGAPPPEVEEALYMISEQWLSRKKVGEFGFTMGRFDPAALATQKLAAALEDRRVVAFVSWRPFGDKRLTLDLMRYAADAPKFVMDYLIARSLLYFQQQGYELASLANAPLANVSPEEEFTMLDKGVRLLFENVRGIYEYKSLFQFKKKFSPRWEGRYLVFPSLEALPRTAVALLRVHRQPALEAAILGTA